MADNERFAVITGASTGIGFELAKCCVQAGFDVAIAADEPEIQKAAQVLREFGTNVEAHEVDLATTSGVDQLWQSLKTRPVDALLANAGIGLGHAFLDQDFERIMRVVNTNIMGTLDLIHRAGRAMRERNSGRILITGSIAGFMPGSFQAVYNGSKAFLDSFAAALGNELKDTDIKVTCLMPGATDTRFFERAGLMDTKIGQDKKDNPADVAAKGFEAMMEGDDAVITGWKNRLQVAATRLMPSSVAAEQHRRVTEPGSGDRAR